MTDLAGLPYTELRFDVRGARLDTGPIAPVGVTDLIVISHGWHQDGRDAKTMYADLLGHVKAFAAAHPATAGRKIGVAGVYWPSDKYQDDLSLETRPPDTGPAVSINDADISTPDLKERAREVAELLGLNPADFAALAVQASNGGKSADDLVGALRGAISPPEDVEAQAEHGDLLGDTPGSQILVEMQAALDAAAQGQVAPAAPEAPAVSFLSGVRARIARLLNQAAYYELKTRAGRVGQGLGRALDADGLVGVERLHLIGHSFGARLVTSAAATLTVVKPYSLTLLQAAFSHNSFGVDIGPNKVVGGFRDVVAGSRVSGRIVISHTWNDRATGIAYALASGVANQIASAVLNTSAWFGGPDDLHGALGANGALRLKGGEGDNQVYDGASVPTLATGRVSSRRCDFIPDHCGITGVETARLVVGAMS